MRVGVLVALLLTTQYSYSSPEDSQKTACRDAEVMRFEDQGLHETLANILSKREAAKGGKLGLYAVDLESGKYVDFDADVPVQTASVIKLGILYEAMVAVREGRARWDEVIVMKPSDVVGGSGMLHFFDTPLSLTLKDLLTMMVTVSDNTATNMMIDRFGLERINARVESLGLRNTHLYKKVFKPAEGAMPSDQPKFGLGKTTPREMADLMTDIGQCRLHPEARERGWVPMDEQDISICAVALGILKNQFYRDTVPRYLPNGGDQTVASKTGSLDAVRNDVAIVAGKNGPIVLSIFTYDNRDQSWTADNEAEVTIAQLAKEITYRWSPSGLDAKGLIPGLGLVPTAGCSVSGKTHVL